MSRWQLGFQIRILESWQPANLVEDVPEEECRTLRAESRSLTAEERWGLIRDLCQKHMGRGARDQWFMALPVDALPNGGQVLSCAVLIDL